MYSVHADWSKIAKPYDGVGPPRLTMEEALAGRWSGPRRIVMPCTFRSLPGSGFVDGDGKDEERFFEFVGEIDGDITLMSDGDSTNFILASDVGATYERLVEPRHVEVWCDHEELHPWRR